MSERYLPAEIVELMEADVVRPAVFIKAVFPAPAGTKRYWTGDGSFVDEDENTWIGIGNLLSISSIPESTDLMAQGISFRLAGIDPDEVDELIGGDYQWGPVEIWIGYWKRDTHEMFVDWENPTWAGALDQDEEDRGRESSELSIFCEHELVDMLRKKEFRYTIQDQKYLYPEVNDTGLDKLEGIQKLIVPWGKTQK